MQFEIPGNRFFQVVSFVHGNPMYTVGGRTGRNGYLYEACGYFVSGFYHQFSLPSVGLLKYASNALSRSYPLKYHRL